MNIIQQGLQLSAVKRVTGRLKEASGDVRQAAAAATATALNVRAIEDIGGPQGLEFRVRL